ncbi:hypothetical protein [Halobacterium bonnevillei]|uniref:DUF4157 domain-containing protein n=1 Tax=Halobacterium bonnevillei TaxID=2692200 RepID=A0A6B0SHA9_9EURY|nr:hypothetical protein [Halobacterium bonnevillei]MXR21038.1 hypothetical protein [Halobacterium bonnevillei]
MERRRVLATLAVVALLVVAGCQSPGAPQSPDGGAPTATATSDPATTRATADSTTTESTTATANSSDGLVRVDDDFGFDVPPIYHRVGRMLEVPRADRPEVQVRTEDPPDDGGSVVARPQGFVGLVGIVPQNPVGGDESVGTAAVARGTLVTVYSDGDLNATLTESTLAHEFAHVYQFTAHDPRSVVKSLGPNRNNARLTEVVVEGSAEYVQEEYEIRHQDRDVDQSEFAAAWKRAPAFQRWTVASYVYGSRYVELRIDDPANVTDVYQNPPRSTEQVIHGFTPDEEPVADLTVTADTTGPFAWSNAATKGELFARIALSTELDWERAAAAAEGWGADRLLTFSDGDRAGYAWALRWDDASEADEFRDAFADYDDRNDERFRLEAVGDETVVVFAGADAFVENATATGNSSSVTVST